jgi:hypothetical protein
MSTIYARLSKAGRIVCGRPDVDGRLSCDEPLALVVTVHEPPLHPERLLVPLPGWRQDRKGVWRRTTRVEDLRARGVALARAAPRARGRYPELPALVCCPKCATMQWLEAERLNVSAHPNDTGLTMQHPNRFRLSGVERGQRQLKS